MFTLINHFWLEKKRSVLMQKSLFFSILTWFIGIYILANITVIGWYADELFLQVNPTENVVEKYTGLLLFYLLFDLFARFSLQKLPVVIIQPYLTLPIKKNKLLHLLLLKSIPDFFNLLAICLIAPFFIKAVFPAHSLLFSSVWITVALSLVYMNNFLIYALKIYFSSNSLVILALLFIPGLLLYISIAGYYDIIGNFSTAYLFICNQSFLTILPLLLLCFSYYFALDILNKNSWLESDSSGFSKQSYSFQFLNGFGQTGILLALELKMIMRNKRPRSSLWVSLFFIAYGFFLIYQNDSFFIRFFTAFYIVSVTALMYGQLVISWESTFFESYMANNVSVINYLRSKYLIIAILTLIPYIIAVIFYFKNYKMLILLTSMMLYTIGLASIILLFFGCFRKKRINLDRNTFMNYEGFGAKDFLILIPFFGIPLIIYIIFHQIGFSAIAIYGIGITGFMGIVFNRALLHLIKNFLENRKHSIVQGFRTN